MEGQLEAPEGTISRRKILYELSIVSVIFLAVTFLFKAVLYPFFGVTTSAPIPFRTVILLVALTLIIRGNGERWRDFGLKRFKPGWLLVPLVILFLAIHLFVAQPIGDWVRDLLSIPGSDYSWILHVPA